MSRVLRSALVVALAWFAAFLAVLAIGELRWWLFPLPAGSVERTDPSAFAALISSLPAGSLGLLALAWVVAGFVSALIGSRSSTNAQLVLLVGAGVLAAAAFHTVVVPYPAWFAALLIAAVIGSLFGGAFVGRSTRVGG